MNKRTVYTASQGHKLLAKESDRTVWSGQGRAPASQGDGGSAARQPWLTTLEKASRASGHDLLEAFDEGQRSNAEYEAHQKRRRFANRVTANNVPVVPGVSVPQNARPPDIPITRRDRVADARAVDEARKRLARKGQELTEPAIIPSWARTNAPHWQRSPAEAYDMVARVDKRWAKALRKAATADGRHDVQSLHARTVMALGTLYFMMADVRAEGAVDRVLVANLEFIRDLFPGPSGAGYSRSWFTNRNHGKGDEALTGDKGPKNGKVGDATQGNCGAIESLRQLAGLVVEQPRSYQCPPWAVGPSGFAFYQVIFPAEGMSAADVFAMYTAPALHDPG